jgi:hypothetical protein
MENLEKQPVPATKRKRVPATILTPTSPGHEALSVELAARSGNVLATLIALRQRLAADLDRCRNKRVMASLAGRLADVTARIEAEERTDRGQQRGQSASNRDEAAERVRYSLAEAAAAGGQVPDALL